MARLVYSFAVSKIQGLLFIGECSCSFAVFGITGFASNFRDKIPVSTEKKGIETHIPICTKYECGHPDFDDGPLEFGYLRIYGMG